MQCSDGGWGAFDADNDSRLVAALPFCDFGKVTDPPSADVTAHVIEMLADEPSVAPEVLQRGLAWLWGQQEADGSWFGRWGVNYVYGTGAAVPALIRAGVAPADPRIRRAVTWLEEHQKPMAAGAKTCGPTSTRAGGAEAPQPHRRRRGRCWPSWLPARHTAQSPGEASHWLTSTQQADGNWDEPWYTGTGFPWDFSINYHLYRLVWPLMALGRYRDCSRPADHDQPRRSHCPPRVGLLVLAPLRVEARAVTVADPGSRVVRAGARLAPGRQHRAAPFMTGTGPRPWPWPAWPGP